MTGPEIYVRNAELMCPDGSKRMTVEDSWGAHDEGKRMPVMNRAPGGVEH